VQPNQTKYKGYPHVYLDLDRKGDQALEAIRNSTESQRQTLSRHLPGKHQVVWKVSGFSQEAESLLHRLANQFGGDPAATDSTVCCACRDSPTANFPRNLSSKRDRKAMRSTRSAISRLKKTCPKRLGIQPKNKEPSAPHPATHKSQSEHDWAYAKRASPAATIRSNNPAHRRLTGIGQAQPEYYARHTVQKHSLISRKPN